MNTLLPTVLCVAGDPGGASALTPVLPKLQADFHVCLAAYQQALNQWSNAGHAVRPLDGSPSLDAAIAVLQEIRPALLLTATSANGLDWECHLLQAARQLGIHSLSLLDFWSNYTRRFSLAEPLDALPQRICVMDQRAVEEMVAEGFSRSMLLITGQPALDLAAQPAAAEQLQAARSLWPQGDRRLLFVSQPLSVLHGGDAGCNQVLGYNEHAVLSLVATVTQQLASEGRPLSLRVLPHPRESAGTFSSAGYIVAQGYAAKVLAQAADIVIGMNSMLLLEAAAAGCVVVSVQPDLRGKDSLATNQSRVTVPVYQAARLLPVLASLLDDSLAYATQQKLARQMVCAGNAADCVVASVRCLLSEAIPKIS